MANFPQLIGLRLGGRRQDARLRSRLVPAVFASINHVCTLQYSEGQEVAHRYVGPYRGF